MRQAVGKKKGEEAGLVHVQPPACQPITCLPARKVRLGDVGKWERQNGRMVGEQKEAEFHNQHHLGRRLQ